MKQFLKAVIGDLFPKVLADKKDIKKEELKKRCIDLQDI